MATRDEVVQAIRNADAIGDSASVRKLGAYLESMSADGPEAQKPTAAPPAPEESFGSRMLQHAGNLTAGAVRGAGSIGATILAPVDAAARAMGIENDFIGRNDRRAGMDGALQEMGAQPDSMAYQGGKMAAELAGTAGGGGVLARGAVALAPKLAAAAPGLVNAVRTSGMAAGPAAPGFVGGAASLATRAAGGAITGGVSAGMVDPHDAATGAGISAAIPVLGKAAGVVGKAAGSVVRPFFNAGQERIAGDALREFSTNPAALANLRAAQAVVPGSAPTAMMAAGDEGISGLSRTLQSLNPQYAAELSTRQAAQNGARTAAIEGIAGNTGKLAAAREARDAATSTMRENALDAAGQLEATPVLTRIDSMLRNPNNAGRIAQQALKGVREQIAGATENGAVDARALYAIRKDIGDVLDGKLQGDAGNLKYASGQLVAVKDLIDKAIEQAGARVSTSTGTALVLAGQGAVALPGAAAAAGPRASWKQYLDTYSKDSVPINQMELLDDVMKRVQTGTVDSGGNMVLSAAKLNNIMKNEGQDLMKKLDPQQIDLIRRLAGDLNASQLATTAGKAAGSNTVQNLASAGILQSTLGNKLGGSTPIANTAGAGLDLLYKRANRQITEKIGAALLDPAEAARLMQDPATQGAISRLFDRSGARQLGYQTAPVLGSQ